MRIGFVFALSILLFGCTQPAEEGTTDADDTSMPVEAVADASSSPTIPEFPLPAPRPSSRGPIAISEFGSPQRIKDIADPLSAALAQSGYEHMGYYDVPGGFALITQTERIHANGRPYDGDDRFLFEPRALFDFYEFFEDFPRGLLERLSNVDPGRYRVIIFLLTTEAVTSNSEETDYDTVENWVEDGGDYLPPYVANRRIGPTHNMSVLVYEFRRASAGEDVDLLRESVEASQHLSATGIAWGGS